jgi:hypothetical protein
VSRLSLARAMARKGIAIDSLADATTTNYDVVMTAPRSVRFDEAVLARLDKYVKEHPGSSSSSVANMFIDESLRMYEHPGIVFRPGPTGRRATLAGGPDVWEVIAALQAVRSESPDLDGDFLINELAAVTGLSTARLGVALRYYAAYPKEIEERIVSNAEVAEREEQLWAAQQALLQRRKP